MRSSSEERIWYRNPPRYMYHLMGNNQGHDWASATALCHRPIRSRFHWVSEESVKKLGRSFCKDCLKRSLAADRA